MMCNAAVSFYTCSTPYVKKGTALIIPLSVFSFLPLGKIPKILERIWDQIWNRQTDTHTAVFIELLLQLKQDLYYFNKCSMLLNYEDICGATVVVVQPDN
jgi:hypothetical protein